MSNIIEHPRAVEIARKMEWEAERASRAAREKAERAEHRKWLKETKPEREAERARRRRLDAARARVFGAASDAAWEVADKATNEAALWNVAYDEAYFAILDTVGLAAEAAAAKAAGYETWAAFKAAQEAQEAADDAAYEEKEAATHRNHTRRKILRRYKKPASATASTSPSTCITKPPASWVNALSSVVE